MGNLFKIITKYNINQEKIMKKIISFGIPFLILLLVLSSSNASNLDINQQNGQTYGTCVGYNLLADINSKPILIDMEGNIIHIWNNISFGAIMLPGGSAIGPNTLREEYIFGREYCEMTEESWDGKIKWKFSNWDNDSNGLMMARQHHDFVRDGNPIGYYAPSQDFVSNGNTLILGHYNEVVKEISNKELVNDVIYEVNYKGNLTGFEWRASDHFDEFGFNLKEKIGMYLFPGYHLIFTIPNLRNWSFIKCDWFHLNSISRLGKNHWYDEGDDRFNPKNIMISSRHANIIAIIDFEKGNIVWKIGPNYSKETEEGKNIGQIIGPHHAHIIPKGLPGAGNLLIFDNGGISGYGMCGMPNKFRFYSRIIEINPSTKEIVWEYSHKKGLSLIPSGEYHKFFSKFLSSAQRLPNGNTLITEGMSKRIFEVNQEKEIVWEFIFSGIVYRCYRIPPEWVPGNPAGYPYWEN